MTLGKNQSRFFLGASLVLALMLSTTVAFGQLEDQTSKAATSAPAPAATPAPVATSDAPAEQPAAAPVNICDKVRVEGGNVGSKTVTGDGACYVEVTADVQTEIKEVPTDPPYLYYWFAGIAILSFAIGLLFSFMAISKKGGHDGETKVKRGTAANGVIGLICLGMAAQANAATVTSIAPYKTEQGKTVEMTITGTGFGSDAGKIHVTLSGTPAIPEATVKSVEPKKLVVTFAIPAGIPDTKRELMIDDGSGVKATGRILYIVNPTTSTGLDVATERFASKADLQLGLNRVSGIATKALKATESLDKRVAALEAKVGQPETHASSATQTVVQQVDMSAYDARLTQLQAQLDKSMAAMGDDSRIQSAENRLEDIERRQEFYAKARIKTGVFGKESLQKIAEDTDTKDQRAQEKADRKAAKSQGRTGQSSEECPKGRRCLVVLPQ